MVRGGAVVAALTVPGNNISWKEAGVKEQDALATRCANLNGWVRFLQVLGAARKFVSAHTRGGEWWRRCQPIVDVVGLQKAAADAGRLLN